MIHKSFQNMIKYYTTAGDSAQCKSVLLPCSVSHDDSVKSPVINYICDVFFFFCLRENTQTVEHFSLGAFYVSHKLRDLLERCDNKARRREL